jgi:polar amino acid transport system substrate-binding protein
MMFPFPFQSASSEIRSALAPLGFVRAGINLSNTLLVSARTSEGEPDGVSPDMARAVGAALDVPVRLIPYQTPGEVADAIVRNEWDIGLIAAEPQRAETIAFTPAYAEIEACFCVRTKSGMMSLADIDRSGQLISTTSRAAFTLWLERHIKHATLVPVESLDAARELFVGGGADVLASLKSKLEDQPIPDTQILSTPFMTVQQAIGCAKLQTASTQWLTHFVLAACKSGFVTSRIQHHGVRGLESAQRG